MDSSFLLPCSDPFSVKGYGYFWERAVGLSSENEKARKENPSGPRRAYDPKRLVQDVVGGRDQARRRRRNRLGVVAGRERAAGVERANRQGTGPYQKGIIEKGFINEKL